MPILRGGDSFRAAFPARLVPHYTTCMRHSRSKPKPAAKGAANAPQQPAARQRPQFTIIGMFVVMLICSVASAGAYYLVREGGQDPSAKLTALLFLLAGPMLLMVIVSLLVALAGRFK